MTHAIKALFALIILAGMVITFFATCIMVILPDWWSFTAGMIGFALIGTGALVYKLLDNRDNK